jgi:hypothetical protein
MRISRLSAGVFKVERLMIPRAQAAHGTAGKKLPDRLPTNDNSSRAIATAVLEVFLAGM